MNRTTANVLFSALSLAGAVASQAAAPAASDTSQANAVKSFVAKMVKAERALKGLRMTMETSGRMPGGLNLKTAGELRVLRGTQPESLERRFSRLEYSFGDDVRGRMESAETAEGILVFEEDPAFGAVFVRIDPAVVRDHNAGQLLSPGCPSLRIIHSSLSVSLCVSDTHMHPH